MQEIKIYDFNFNLIASEFKCICFEWDTRYNSIGTFEGEFTLDSPVYKCCENKDFLVCVQGLNQGIITSVRIEGDRIKISGKGMNYILQKRICLPFSTKDGSEKSATEIVCELVEKHCGDFMEVMPAPLLSTTAHYTRIAAKPLGEIIIDILAGVNAGHYVKFDVENKKWVFGCLLPNVRSFVLSQPDNTLSECDYVKYLSDYATTGVYEQKPYYMGTWDADRNVPALDNKNPDNFAKVYKVETEGVIFGDRYYAGNYIICTTKDGTWTQSDTYGSFWHYVCPKAGEGALRWETVLECDDESEATEMTLLRDIEENAVALVQGISKEEFSIGDVVQIQFMPYDELKVFTKQIKRITYHYEFGNCFVRPTFYKMKENEDE